jgi:hypothetical protein
MTVTGLSGTDLDVVYDHDALNRIYEIEATTLDGVGMKPIANYTYFGGRMQRRSPASVLS